MEKSEYENNGPGILVQKLLAWRYVTNWDNTAQGVETITRKEENKLRQTCQRIWSADSKNMGLHPLFWGILRIMNDTIGERAEKTEEFKAMLERRTGLPVILWDERLTTVEADEILEESGVPRSERKKVIDKIAAGLILQSYLNSLETKK